MGKATESKLNKVGIGSIVKLRPYPVDRSFLFLFLIPMHGPTSMRLAVMNASKRLFRPRTTKNVKLAL